MTCKERLMKEHPYANADYIVLHRCPSEYGYLEKPESCADCTACWNREIPEIKETPVRFKIFSEDVAPTTCSIRADDQVNIWLDANPNIDILDFKYCESDSKHHSICIMYKEVKAE